MNYLVLVNKNNKFDNSNLDLVECNDIMGRLIKVDRTTYNAYLELKKFLEAQKIFIEIDSSYRSLEEQQKILDDTIKESGIEHASKYVAPVGYSEHHTGLAIDLALIVDGKKILDDGTIDMFIYDDIFKEIHKYLKDFGFILRYPEGKESITGYNYEPWHIRYVGDVAKEINSTLEEYLDYTITPKEVFDILNNDEKNGDYMICNDKEVEIEKVEAFYIIRKHSWSTYIEVISKEEDRIDFTISDKEFDPRLLKINECVDLVPHICWDVTLNTKETYYLFDLTKDKVELTRLDDNLFKIKVDIENPNMIYSPLASDATFKNLKFETNFSFIYEEKKEVI